MGGYGRRSSEGGMPEACKAKACWIVSRSALRPVVVSMDMEVGLIYFLVFFWVHA